MKNSTFYQAAFEDTGFRRQQIEDLRYFKKVEVGFLAMSLMGFAIHTIYFGVNEGRWDTGGTWLLIASVSCLGYCVTAERLTALRAIDANAEPVDTANGLTQPAISNGASSLDRAG